VTSCDILLVIGTFRSAVPMLSLIRHLSSKHVIGVKFLEQDEKAMHKTGGAQLMFQDLCTQFGAKILAQDEDVETRFVLVQQFPYPASFAAAIHDHTKAEHVWGMLTLAWAGIEVQDAFMDQFDIKHLVVPDKRFASFLIERRGAQLRYAERVLDEVGLPFKEYPIFPEFAADWIIAAPTLFSFHTEAGKQSFLRDVLKLLSQIPKTDIVAYKAHNGNQRDYFTPRAYYAIARLFAFVPKAEAFFGFLADHLPAKLAKHCERIVTGILHRRLFARACPMASLTDYGDMAIEAFLPNVRKGIIGGLSNTIWASLFFGLPYYNCVDAEDRTGESELLKRDSSSLLDTNLEYFGVPYCHGDLAQGAKNPEILHSKERHDNLVDLFLRELEV